MGRSILAAVLACLLLASGASADPPQGGEGHDLQFVSHLSLPEINEIELAGDYAFITADNSGLFIVNISDPLHPRLESTWICEAGWADVELSPDAKMAVVVNAHGGECLDGGVQVALLDISDKAAPTLLGVIRKSPEHEYVHTATLDDKTLYLNPQVWALYPQDTTHIPIYDVSDPRNPKSTGFIEFPSQAVAHDSFVDHRPDGKNLLYSASMHTTDVFDITDPMTPVAMQTVPAGETTLSHQAEPNHDRSLIIVSDESAAGFRFESAQPGVVCGKVGVSGPLSVDAGAVHFYLANEDGTFLGNGATPIGSFNIPFKPAESDCTAHVFWTAPNENRLTQAWYTEGAFVLDFTDPMNVKELGTFKAVGDTNYWSFKPHRGYIFATDQNRGLDILRYTGEGGTRWPATAPPAEMQRSARQGVPYVPIESAKPLPPVPQDTRSLGKFSFTAKLKRVPGRRGSKSRLTITFTDTARKRVASVRFKRAAGKAGKARVSGVAVAGSYSWVVKAGRRTIARGKLTVKQRSGVTLAPKLKLTAAVK